ncbi:MAG: S8 family serine peptidase, partial [Thermoleophilia bacterium]|nr:S8 family serine peptidase [Thermoleophilia bacterium]
GYPRGQLAYTNGKVIVARSFAPAGTRWRYARRPFDPTGSDHGTHVAGIAAGNHGTRASAGAALAGVAPRAYIGNYKALSVPAPGGSLNGNSPELVAAIEAAVADGMDVLNLSLGEPEVEPARDVVARAIDAAADAGVPSAVAAGNDYDDLGRGSLASPGSAAKAITAGAVEFRDGRALIAHFSAAGPTPLSLRLKPDVAAPGSEVLSSVPGRRFAAFSGTSMAAPHVAGAAALLRQRHPTWTVEQIKSALVTTGVAVRSERTPAVEVPVTREGGGLIDLARADEPLVFASPTSASFGLVRPGSTLTRTITLADAGGGAGPWTASLERQTPSAGATVEVPAAAAVPGGIPVTLRVRPDALQREEGGFVVLTRGTARRRIPYWFRVSRPRLAAARPFPLRRTGTYGGNTAGRAARVTTYRYPDDPSPLGVTRVLRGPEQVFRIRVRRRVANFGAAIVTRARGVQVEPRIVRAGDENRLTGSVGLPLVVNAYLARYSQTAPVAGAILPAPGAYDVVFDSRTRKGAGRFTFRFWVDDVRPPSLRLLTRTVKNYSFLRVAARDSGSGIDPASVVARIDGRAAPAAYDRRSQRVLVLVAGARRGRHRLVLQVSDHQETKNVENVARILPNTATLRGTFGVR